MHQLSKRSVVSVLSVHIDYVRLVTKNAAGFFHDPVDVVDWLRAFEHIILRNHYNIS